MRIHFISIGGAVMHNLAIALYHKGYKVTGSDDEIFNPSKDRLQHYGLLPDDFGWFPKKITPDIDAIILGMHAKADNPELLKAQEMKLKIYSFPEYLYEQTKDKTRVVVGGSHGKTTITAIIMHVLKNNNVAFDYMVGAQLEGFDTMVGLSEKSKIAVFEGDEYLTSAMDKRPKFHLYKPHIALLSGIAWDHINVFPTFENYCDQFSRFIEIIEPHGKLIYYREDKHLSEIVAKSTQAITKTGYKAHPADKEGDNTFLIAGDKKIPVPIFGDHNLQNIQGAKMICQHLGIGNDGFYAAIQSFKGAAKRLQLLESNNNTKIFMDFAHAPSKLNASIRAVKNQYPENKLIACMELHTFSSLNQAFLPHYKNSMDAADEAIVFFDPHAIRLKRLQDLQPDDIKKSFGNEKIRVFNQSAELHEYLNSLKLEKTNLLLMSSGNFGGLNIKEFAKKLIHK